MAGKGKGSARRERLPRNVSGFVDRHGKRRYRFRKVGCADAWFDHPPSEAEVAPLRAGTAATSDRHAPGTVAWLLARFLASPGFVSGKGADREREARRILSHFAAQFGRDRVADFRFDHIEAILMQAAQPGISEKGRKTGGPHAARNLRRELVPLFNYAIKLGLIASNPVQLAQAPKAPRGGFHTWTEAEIDQFRAHWPLGSKPRLALEIILWTVARKGDASTFGPRHVLPAQLGQPARIVFTAAKTGKLASLPMAPQLQAAIDAMPVVGTEAFLLTAYGKPFSKAGLGNAMRDWCNAAGLPHCSAHGLRKATARRAAEAGSGNQGLKAIGQWSSDSQVATYTQAAEQAALADAALAPVIAMDRNKGGKIV